MRLNPEVLHFQISACGERIICFAKNDTRVFEAREQGAAMDESKECGNSQSSSASVTEKAQLFGMKVGWMALRSVPIGGVLQSIVDGPDACSGAYIEDILGIGDGCEMWLAVKG